MRDISNLEPATPPASCPACRSRDLVTTSKVANADSYWRCCACGEVWNAARLKAGSRYQQQDNPFRR
jgi:predicted Zn finger-like uncharacterized protein